MFIVHKAGYNSYHMDGFQVKWPVGRGKMQLLVVRTPAIFELPEQVLTLKKKDDTGELYDEVTGFLCDRRAKYGTFVRVHTTQPVILFFTEEAPQVYYSTEDYSNDWILLDPPDLETKQFLDQLAVPFDRPIVLSSFSEISNLVRDFVQEVHQSGFHHQTILDFKLKTILLKFCDLYQIETGLSGKLKRYRSSFQEIRNEIFLHPEKSQAVTELAKMQNMSVSYFQHIYKELFDSTVVKDLISARIEKACYLLNTGTESAHLVSERCGYDNYEHFCRQFKEITGYTPKKYQLSRVQ